MKNDDYMKPATCFIMSLTQISHALWKGGNNVSAKSFDPGQPAQADPSRNFLISVKSVQFKGPMYLVITLLVIENGL